MGRGAGNVRRSFEKALKGYFAVGIAGFVQGHGPHPDLGYPPDAGMPVAVILGDR
ncbi:hypothetical protein SDC9_187886 [bioreactor metagenome]|uniref:Uncharacterized protein n=1 Tax=bioreactor metagenome TaxID=1076179 RepID=A0A645HNE7_9ZZZZ